MQESRAAGVQVRQSLLVVDTLIDQYDIALDRFMAAWKQDQGHDMSAMRADVERIYCAIWEQLDTSAKLTSSAGRSATDYAAIRANPNLETAAAIADVTERHVGSELRMRGTVETFELSVRHNGEGIAIARNGLAALKAAWPELEWRIVDQPQVDLRPGGIGRVITFFADLFGKK